MVNKFVLFPLAPVGRNDLFIVIPAERECIVKATGFQLSLE